MSGLYDFLKRAALIFQCGPPKAVKCHEGMSVSLTVPADPTRPEGRQRWVGGTRLTIEWEEGVLSIANYRRLLSGGSGVSHLLSEMVGSVRKCRALRGVFSLLHSWSIACKCRFLSVFLAAA